MSRLTNIASVGRRALPNHWDVLAFVAIMAVLVATVRGYHGMAVPLPAADEPVVIKHRYSAFINTRLDSILRTMKVENIIVLGVATNVCVESTARHGYMLDYHCVFVADCSATYDQAAHEMTLKVFRKHFGTVVNAQDIIDTWAATHSVAASA